MGRDTETIAQWQGQTAEVRAVLESAEIILRGGIRDRVPRDEITAMTAEQGWLTLSTVRGPLVLELGEVEAARWLMALRKPAPTLVQKLGVGAGCLAYVTGDAPDAALAVALQGETVPTLAEAGIIIAVLDAPGDLDAAFSLAVSAPHLALWCVYQKGKAAVTDAMVRDYFRARGYVDTKSSAVSGKLTATRYGVRRS